MIRWRSSHTGDPAVGAVVGMGEIKLLDETQSEREPSEGSCPSDRMNPTPPFISIIAEALTTGFLSASLT
jgi:hypothetical protein